MPAVEARRSISTGRSQAEERLQRQQAAIEDAERFVWASKVIRNCLPNMDAYYHKETGGQDLTECLMRQDIVGPSPGTAVSKAMKCLANLPVFQWPAESDQKTRDDITNRNRENATGMVAAIDRCIRNEIRL